MSFLPISIVLVRAATWSFSVRMQAYVTLVTSDGYAIGAYTLAQSLRETGTTHPIIAIVTDGLSAVSRVRLSKVFDELRSVPLLASENPQNLALIGRPELLGTLTKIHLWGMTDCTKVVYLDADTLVLSNIDELFNRQTLSAAPDIGNQHFKTAV